MASNDILDSWEDFTDYEAPKSGKTKKSNAGGGNDTSSSVVVTEETHRTQYKPQIRILKREPQDNKRGGINLNNANDGVTADNSNEAKPKAKTLAQREAEYAEARRRILGPSYNPEEQQQLQQQQPPAQPQPLTTSMPPPLVPPFPPPPPSLADLVPPYPPPPILPHPNHVHPPAHQPSTYDDQSPRRLAQRMENLKMNPPGVVVVRQPNGPDPDGFRGFTSYKSHDMRR